MASSYPTTSIPIFIVSLIFGISAGVITFLVSERKHRALKKNPRRESMTIASDPVHLNLPRLWTVPRILAVILGFALMAIGTEYFWSIPGTPPDDFLAGLACVIGGVLLIIIPVDLGLISRARARNKARNQQS